MKFKNIIFLDIDGVLNTKVHNEKRFTDFYHEKILMLNDLCEETDSAVVISSSWRICKKVAYLQKLFKDWGATFNIIDKTPHTGYERGVDIAKWLNNNCGKYFGVDKSDFYRYAIIDDNADMLLEQQYNFFKTDPYCGLTHETCKRIKKLFNRILK